MPYLVFSLLAVRFFETSFELPASSLLPELTRDNKERTGSSPISTLIESRRPAR